MEEATGNSAKLRAVVELVAKMDKTSFKAVEDTIKKMGGSSSDTSNSTGSNQNKDKSNGGAKLVQEGMGTVTGGATGGGAGAVNGAAGAGAGEGGGAGAGIMMGIAAGMKVITSIMELLGKMAQLIIDSSPLLQSVLKLLSTSIKLLFMPLGNMIARILMPIMLKYLQKGAERAQKYAAGGNASIEELTSGAVTDMVSAMMEIFGAVMTQVLPGLFKGLLEGIWNALTGGSASSTLSAFDQNMKAYQQKYTDAVKNTGALASEFSVGLASGIDQFGLVMYTANNDAGKAVSSLATTVYKGATTIENGFNASHTVFVQGTSDIIDVINEKFNLVGTAITTTYETITGYASTFGSDVASLISTLGTNNISLNTQLSTTTTNVSDLNTLIGSSESNTGICGGLNKLVSALTATANAILGIQTDKKLDASDLGSIRTTNLGGSDVGATSTDYLFSDVGGTNKIVELSSQEKADMGFEGQKRLFVRTVEGTGRYVIQDAMGNVVKYGINDQNAFNTNFNYNAAWNSSRGSGISSEERGQSGYWNIWDYLRDAQGSGSEDPFATIVNRLMADSERALTVDASGSTYKVAAAGGKVVSGGAQSMIAGEAGTEVIYNPGSEARDKMSNDEILGRLRSAINPNELDHKLSNLLSSGGLMGKQKTLSAPSTVHLEIHGNIIGVPELEDAVQKALEKYSYMMKGAY